jgi:7-keto-8-aminopelargonate synthetase-like enzyme
MLDDGIFVSAVVFPAVSPGQARLRLCALATHRPDHFQALFEALERRRAEDAADAA